MDRRDGSNSDVSSCWSGRDSYRNTLFIEKRMSALCIFVVLLLAYQPRGVDDCESTTCLAIDG